MSFFQEGRTYMRTDVAEACCEFRCVKVEDAPTPGAMGTFAFGFEITRGEGCLCRWFPAVMGEKNGVPAHGSWVEYDVAA
jgi:hypothetical protein